MQDRRNVYGGFSLYPNHNLTHHIVVFSCTAIAINDFNAMHEILITDIDVNVPDSRGVFPVMYAVEYGNANALISLIRHRANVNVVYKQTRYSLLMKALSQKPIPNRYLIIVLMHYVCRRMSMCI